MTYLRCPWQLDVTNYFLKSKLKHLKGICIYRCLLRDLPIKSNLKKKKTILCAVMSCIVIVAIIRSPFGHYCWLSVHFKSSYPLCFWKFARRVSAPAAIFIRSQNIVGYVTITAAYELQQKNSAEGARFLFWRCSGNESRAENMPVEVSHRWCGTP